MPAIPWETARLLREGVYVCIYNGADFLALRSIEAQPSLSARAVAFP